MHEISYSGVFQLGIRFSGKNFMTPVTVGYYRTKFYIAELTRDPQHQDCPFGEMWGVTVKSIETKQDVRRLSEPFDTKKEAMTHIELLDNLNP